MIESPGNIGVINNQRYYDNTFNKTANINQPKIKPQPAVDTAELSTINKIKERYKNLSSAEKCALGIGAALAAGILVYAFRGKLNNLFKTFKQIEFKPASTIEEAQKFAKSKLGVRYTTDVKTIKYTKEDLDIVNFINEWLVETHNKMGKKFYPRTVIKDSSLADKYEALFAFCRDNNGNHALSFNSDSLKFQFDELKKLIESRCNIYAKDTAGNFKIINKDYDVPFVKDIINRLNTHIKSPDKLSFKEKMQLTLDIESTFTAFRKNGKLTFRKPNIFQFLDHEQGHYLHWKNLLKTIKNQELPEKVVQEFENNKEILLTARQVSAYALEHPDEFVADAFAMMKRGVKFDKEVLDLYKKLHGPKIDKILTS